MILDTETTGLNHRKDEIIEIGIIAFTFDGAGNIGDVIGVYGGLQQPSIAIPPEITRLTGITDDMVAGQAIDAHRLRAIVEPADLMIAHNAGFDRPFCEAFSTIFAGKAWACSVSEIDWASRGFEGTKLGYLIGQAGYRTTPREAQRCGRSHSSQSLDAATARNFPAHPHRESLDQYAMGRADGRGGAALPDRARAKPAR